VTFPTADGYGAVPDRVSLEYFGENTSTEDTALNSGHLVCGDQRTTSGKTSPVVVSSWGMLPKHGSHLLIDSVPRVFTLACPIVYAGSIPASGDQRLLLPNHAIFPVQMEN
jgi:hypothetical protein